MRTYSTEELKEVLEKHVKWLIGQEGGERADLSCADLRNVDLSYANLQSAYLYDSNLSSANLTGVSLSNAKLYRSDLREAILESASLTGSDLTNADMRGTNLKRAIMFGIEVSGVRGQEFTTVGNIGSRKKTIVYHIGLDALFGDSYEPFHGTLDGFKTDISQHFPKENLYHLEYKAAIAYLEQRREAYRLTNK